MTLTVIAPPGETFAFLQSISLSIAAAGLPDQQIASLSPVPAQGTISLDPTPGVNLLPYIKSAATITATASGHVPARDVTFNGKLVITIKI